MVAGCGGALGALLFNNLLRMAKIKKIEVKDDKTKQGYMPIIGSNTDWSNQLEEAMDE